MRHFKKAVIATAIAFGVVTVLSIAGMVYIMQTGGGDKRAARLGQGMGILLGVIIAPFWIYGASEMGKERREALKKSKSKTTNPRRKAKG